jgi:hypothetical protein
MEMRTLDATLETLDEAEDDLMGRSFPYVHPASFREGVEAPMEAVRAILAKARQEAGLPGEARVHTLVASGG